jgi:two-component system, LytTR family, response regulator LytT
MTGIQTKLPLPNFVRVHKSFIINTNKVERIDGTLIWIGKTEIPIGASYKANLMQIFNL